MIRARKATSGNTIPLGFSSSFTGRTKQMYSPLAGRVLTYQETYTIRVTPAGSVPDSLDAMKASLNAQYASGTPESGNMPIDAQTDSIVLFQGSVTNQYKFRTWVAETQTVPAGTLVGPLFWACVCIFLIITTAIIVVAVLCYSAFMAVANALMPGKPSYIGGADPNNPTTYNDWASYLSGQNLLYWYVCPKCGAGFGLKSSYPNIADVPAEEVARYNEHKADCLGIPQTNYDPTMLFIYAVVGVGAIVFLIYGLPKIFSAARGK